MRSYFKVWISYNNDNGLWSIAPFGEKDQAVGLLMPEKIQLCDNLNFQLQYVRYDAFVPASPSTDPPVYAASYSPAELLFADLFTTFEYPDHPKN